MYCNKCGKEIIEESEFCAYCGASQVLNNRPKKKMSKITFAIILIIMIIITCVAGVLVFSSIQNDRNKRQEEARSKTEREYKSVTDEINKDKYNGIGTGSGLTGEIQSIIDESE